MQTFIANFGQGNFLWPQCLAEKTIKILSDESLDPFWVARDLEGWSEYATSKMLTSAGVVVPQGLATRWYNLNAWFHESSGDLWLHRDKDKLWWTLSGTGEASKTIFTEPKPRPGRSARSYIYSRDCTGWSDKDQAGMPLNWNSIHRKARDFLFTEGTLQRPGPENAAYALALIEGRPLMKWHNQPTWVAAANAPGVAAYEQGDALKKTIMNMRVNAISAVFASGKISISEAKVKNFGFDDDAALDKFLAEMIDESDVCALTGLKMSRHDGPDKEMYFSLDRKDSNGHYERTNLQLVCRFANRWKGAKDNQGFLDLIAAIKASI